MKTLSVRVTNKQYRDLKRLKHLLAATENVTQMDYEELQQLNFRVRSAAVKTLLDAPVQRSEVAHG
jgi:hypothetical protein